MTERELVKRLIAQLMAYEVEQRTLEGVLAIVNSQFPEVEVSSLLECIRESVAIRQAVVDRYAPLLEAMENAELAQALLKMPAPEWTN